MVWLSVAGLLSCDPCIHVARRAVTAPDAEHVAVPAEKRPSIRDLSRVRRTATRAVRIAFRPITTDHLDARVGLQPVAQGFPLASGEQVERSMSLQIDDDRAVALPPPHSRNDGTR